MLINKRRRLKKNEQRQIRSWSAAMPAEGEERVVATNLTKSPTEEIQYLEQINRSDKHTETRS